MSETGPDRRTRAFTTAAALFAGSPVVPRFPVPDEIKDDWNDFSLTTVMGDVWSRPGLDPQQRSIVTIALLTAGQKPAQLRAYIAIGLTQGLTRDQVCEVIFHTAAYAGFPAAIEGFRVAHEVFAEFDAAAEATGD